ncbi:transcription factor [Aphanomyces cochlioides]|nr:transcription factor [Aphanomyces cochlioides]
MLEVIGAGVETKVTNTTDYVEVFQNSEEYKQLQAALVVHTVPRADVPEMNYISKRAATNAIQCQYVVQRFMRMYWRTPSYNYTRILLSAERSCPHYSILRSQTFPPFGWLSGHRHFRSCRLQ